MIMNNNEVQTKVVFKYDYNTYYWAGYELEYGWKGEQQENNQEIIETYLRHMQTELNLFKHPLSFAEIYHIYNKGFDYDYTDMRINDMFTELGIDSCNVVSDLLELFAEKNYFRITKSHDHIANNGRITEVKEVVDEIEIDLALFFEPHISYLRKTIDALKTEAQEKGIPIVLF